MYLGSVGGNLERIEATYLTTQAPKRSGQVQVRCGVRQSGGGWLRRERMGDKRGVEEGRDAQRMDGLGLREWKMPSGNEVSQGRVPEVGIRRFSYVDGGKDGAQRLSKIR